MDLSAPQVDERPVSIVTTTIHLPVALEGYVNQVRRRGTRQVSLLVVGDKRTPPETEAWLQRLDAGEGWITYLSPQAQATWLRRFPDLDRLLPWNSIQRRNVGYLIAAEQGAEIIVSIDDDNYVGEDAFVDAHRIIGTTRELDIVQSSNGWFNVCAMLQTQPDVEIVPRGFLQSLRLATPQLTRQRRTGKVAINAGLWLGDPDVDAASRLVAPAQVIGPAADVSFPVALAPGTMCPFNSQNTAFDVRLLPCIYLIVMGGRYRGMTLGRYDDIWMSYFAKHLLDHMGDVVTFGGPFVHQRRNPHDVLEDLAGEVPGMMLSEIIVKALQTVEIHESSYLGAYLELIATLRERFADPSLCGSAERDVLDTVLDGMAIWGATCQELMR